MVVSSNITDPFVQVSSDIKSINDSLSKNRGKLESHLSQLQLDCGKILENMQGLQEEQLILQNNIVGALNSFEEKAGQGQGLQGLFNGNPILKSDIMQKRLQIEQVVTKLRQQSKELAQKIDTTTRNLQETYQTVIPVMQAEEDDLTLLEQNYKQLFSGLDQNLAQQQQSQGNQGGQSGLVMEIPDGQGVSLPVLSPHQNLEDLVGVCNGFLKEAEKYYRQNRIYSDVIASLQEGVREEGYDNPGNHSVPLHYDLH